MDEFYCVIDPTEHSTLDDIMWVSDAEKFFNWAKGGKSSRGLKIHRCAFSAQIDAIQRIEKLAPKFDIIAELVSHLSSLKNTVDVDFNDSGIFVNLEDGDTYCIVTTICPKP